MLEHWAVRKDIEIEESIVISMKIHIHYFMSYMR